MSVGGDCILLFADYKLVGNAEDRSSSPYHAKKLETILVEVDGYVIESAPHLRYLGVVKDTCMTFQEHLKRVSERAMKAIFALSSIMSNIAGPRYTKRKLLTSSIMLFAAPMWGKATNVPTYAAKLRSSCGISALRVACSYRSVSYDAICVISSMMLIELLAQEQADLNVALHPEKNVERENTKVARSLELVN